MLKSIDMYYSAVVNHQIEIAEKNYEGAKNHDIYEERLTDGSLSNFKLVPRSMFFYYVRINANGRLVIDHYLYKNIDEATGEWKPIPHDKDILAGLVKTLAINARPILKGQPRERKPPRLGKGNMTKNPWNRICYVAIFFDESNWSLRKRPTDGSKSAITFIVDENGKTGWPNQAFFDAIDLDIMMPNRWTGKEDKRSAIVFLNHVTRDEDGTLLGYEDPRNPKPEKRDYTFEVIVNVNAEMKDDPPTVFIIDPGGENEGPPLPPPP